MSRAGECCDNAFMKSCFGTVKTELEMTEYDHVPHARAEIGPYLSYCNLERRHSSLGTSAHPIRNPKQRSELTCDTV